MVEVIAALRAAAARLESVSDTPRLDAELLLAHAIGIARGGLLLDPARHAVPAAFAALIDRRLTHEPVAYITGYRDFWSVRINVGPGVLIPRSDSETLVEAALAAVPDRAAALRILDLGTGPGTLLLAVLAEYPAAQGLGIDSSAIALDYAARNAAQLGLAQRAAFQLGDWGGGLSGAFDLILCNPPYIAATEVVMPDVARHEPHGALFAGIDGLDDYRRIMPQVRPLLAPDGVALVEIGWQQASAVTALALTSGLSATVHRDLGGRDRALSLRA